MTAIFCNHVLPKLLSLLTVLLSEYVEYHWKFWHCRSWRYFEKHDGTWFFLARKNTVTRDGVSQMVTVFFYPADFDLRSHVVSDSTFWNTVTSAICHIPIMQYTSHVQYIEPATGTFLGTLLETNAVSNPLPYDWGRDIVDVDLQCLGKWQS